jgi:hypothetical protein
MSGRWPPVGATCLRRVAGSVLLVASLLARPAPALAQLAPFGSPKLGSWLADTAAQALRVAAPDNDLAAGGIAALNRSIASGIDGLRQIGPAWMQGVTVDLRFNENLQAAYEITATQPLFRTGSEQDRLSLRGRFGHDPGGRTGGDLGLRYQRRLFGQDVTLGLDGAIEDYWLQEYRRFGVATEFSSSSLKLRTTLFDDVPDDRAALRGVRDRRLDGYEIEVSARLPYLSWVWLEAKKSWQIVVDSDRPTESDRFSLHLEPLPPLEIETGTASTGDSRSWFAKLRFKIRLGGSA